MIEGNGNGFPFDWLAPGERRYCRCGWRLVPDGEPLCGPCFGVSLMGVRFPTPADYDKIAALNAASAEIEDRTNKLAEARRLAGIPARFWMAE